MGFEQDLVTTDLSGDESAMGERYGLASQINELQDHVAQRMGPASYSTPEDRDS